MWRGTFLAVPGDPLAALGAEAHLDAVVAGLDEAAGRPASGRCPEAPLCCHPPAGEGRAAIRGLSALWAWQVRTGVAGAAALIGEWRPRSPFAQWPYETQAGRLPRYRLQPSGDRPPAFAEKQGLHRPLSGRRHRARDPPGRHGHRRRDCRARPGRPHVLQCAPELRLRAGPGRVPRLRCDGTRRPQMMCEPLEGPRPLFAAIEVVCRGSPSRPGKRLGSRHADLPGLIEAVKGQGGDGRTWHGHGSANQAPGQPCIAPPFTPRVDSLGCR